MTEVKRYDEAAQRAILADAKVIAVVGYSDDPERTSYQIGSFLKDVGYKVYAVNPTVESIDAQSQHDYRLGENSKSENGFAPAAPPPGHGVHHYHFQVFALDVPVDLAAGGERDALVEVAQGHVLAWGEIVGTYERE